LNCKRSTLHIKSNFALFVAFRGQSLHNILINFSEKEESEPKSKTHPPINWRVGKKLLWKRKIITTKM